MFQDEQGVKWVLAIGRWSAMDGRSPHFVLPFFGERLAIAPAFRADVNLGRAGQPRDLSEIDLGEVLLVEVFGVEEQRSNAQGAAVRGIHNFCSNGNTIFDMVVR